MKKVLYARPARLARTQCTTSHEPSVLMQSSILTAPGCQMRSPRARKLKNEVTSRRGRSSRLLRNIFWGSKMGPFHKRHKKRWSYATQNGAVSSQIFLNSSLTRWRWSFRASEWHRLEVAEVQIWSTPEYYVITWYLIGFICNTITRYTAVPGSLY